MAINYTKVTWVNGAPPALSAENINHMDDGIKAATDALDQMAVDSTGLPDATTSKKGVVQLASTGQQDATKVPKATGAEIASILTAGGYSLAPATGTSNLDNIADGATRKAVSATEKTTITALDTEVSGASALGAWSPPRVAELDPDRYHLERISGGRASIRYSTSGRVPIEVVWVEAFNCAEVSPDYCRSRANSTAYVIGQLLMANGQLYEVTTAGTTGSSAPVYPTTVGQSVADGTATITLVQNSYSDLYPAFSVAGVKKGGLWYARFLCDIVSGKPRSIAGQLPYTGATIDSIRTYAAAFGNGASPMTYWDYEALALDAFRKGIIPVGNTYYGRSHKTAESVYGGIRGDLYKPGDTGGGNPYTRGGSAGQIWTHDRSMWGVHDAVGNCYKWVDGVKYMDGELFVHAYDNDPTLLTADGEDLWIATGIFIDGTAAGGDPRFAASVTNYTASVTLPRDAATIKADARDLDYLYRSTYGTVDVMSSIDAIDAAKRLLAFRLQILPKIRSAGLAPFATQEGAMYARNNGERFALRSGTYGDASVAGPRYVNASNPRSSGNAFSLVFKS